VFKVKVALAGDKTLVELTQRFEVHANQITEWKRQLSERAVDVFGGESTAAEPPVDLKELHAKIGQLTLENDFLESALNKVGLLSAKR
jgi:transposase-like protein